MISKILLRFCW